MTTVEFDVVVDAPPEAVWEVISDPRRLPHWDRHIVRVEGVPAEGLREGMRYTTEMRFMAFRTTIDGEVLEWDPPHRAKIRLTGLLDATVTSTIEPLTGGRSLLQHVIDYRFRGGPLGEIAARSLATGRRCAPGAPPRHARAEARHRGAASRAGRTIATRPSPCRSRARVP